MTTQTDNSKLFGGKFDPQKSALKKNNTLPVYVSFVRAKNKSIAKTLLHAEFLKFAPDYADDYFAPKVWEATEGMFCTVEGQFYTDLFTDDIIWNAEKGEPERVLTEPELAGHEEDFRQEDLPSAGKMTLVKNLDMLARSYCLAMFGPVEEVSASQYSQMIDLYNDDVSSPVRELAEAVSKESRVLALHPEKQTECLAWVRQESRPGAKWPDYKNPLTKWCDTPPAQRKPVKNDNKPAEKLSISELQQRNTLLRYRVAAGILSRAMDLNIYSPEIGHEMRINAMLSDKNDTEVNDWFVPFSRTPGVHDFDPASVGAMIKSAPDKLHIYPGEVRKYIDKCISDFDCVNPPPLVVDIACGRSSAPLPQRAEVKSDDQTGQAAQVEVEIPAVCPARAAELDRELEVAFSQPANDEGPESELAERSLEIKTQILCCVNGQTEKIAKSIAGNMLIQNGLSKDSFCALLIDDMADLDNIAQLSDEEIHGLTATSLRNWHLVEADDRGTGLVQLLDLLRSATGGESAGNQTETASNEGEKTEVEEQEDTRKPMDAREIEIAHALNNLMSGHTNVMGKEEAEGVVVCTGYLIADVLPLLIIDITTTEFCLSPNFSDDEIHDVATTILDGWSDDVAVRQKVALDAIVEYRRPEPPKAVVIDPPVITVRPKKDPEPLTVVNNTTSSLSYQQQLTAAALQGLCANPAYRGDYDDIPQMAVMLAVCVINAESGQ